MSICKHQKTRDFVRNSREVNLNEIYFIWAYESWNFEHLANKTCYLSRLFHLFILRNSREVVWRFEDRLQRLSSSPQGTFQFRTKENTTRLSENSFSRLEKLRVFSVFVFPFGKAIKCLCNAKIADYWDFAFVERFRRGMQK